MNEFCARYAGICNCCGNKIHVGDMIRYDTKRCVIHCQCPTKLEAVAYDAVYISFGSGYNPCDIIPTTVDSVWRHNDGRILKVIGVQRKFVREDGMSFGVGEESGYLFHLTCRVASDDESQPIFEQERKSNIKKLYRELVAKIRKNWCMAAKPDNKSDVVITHKGGYSEEVWWLDEGILHTKTF